LKSLLSAVEEILYRNPNFFETPLGFAKAQHKITVYISHPEEKVGVALG